MPTYDLPLASQVTGTLLLVHTRFQLTVNLRYNTREEALTAIQQIVQVGFYRPADPRQAKTSIYYPAHVVDSITVMDAAEYYTMQAKIKAEEVQVGDD